MKIQSSNEMVDRRIKILFWGSWGTRKTETILRYFPDVLIVDTEGNVDQVVGHPDVPEFLYAQTKDVYEIQDLMDKVAAKKIKFKDGRLVKTFAIDTGSILWSVRQDVGAQNAEHRIARYNSSITPDEVTMTPLDWNIAKRPLKSLMTMMANMPIPFLIMTARDTPLYDETGKKGELKIVGTKPDLIKNSQFDFNLSLQFGNDSGGWFAKVDKVQGMLAEAFPMGGVLRKFPHEFLKKYASEIVRAGTQQDETDVAKSNLAREERTQASFSAWANKNYGYNGKQIGDALKAAGFTGFDISRWEEMEKAIADSANGSK